jgi:phosphoribosylformylglycinamidine cyclo-ligase
MDLLKRDAPIRALVHITSDGFLNLARIDANVGFRIDQLPRWHPVFDLIEKSGAIDRAEMYRVFNMGIGFCVIIPDDRAVLGLVLERIHAHEFEAQVIGHVVPDPEKRVYLPAEGLVGRGDRFERG